MRILRIRRGFTTNSSASSEWIPFESGREDTYQLPGPSGIPVTKVVLPMAQATNGWANAAKGGGLVAVIAVAFAAERLARAFRRRKNREGGDEEQDAHL